MARPRCWICFKQLMYVKGVPVFATMRDMGGIEHKVHKVCLQFEQHADEQERLRHSRTGRTQEANAHG